MTAKTDNA